MSVRPNSDAHHLGVEEIRDEYSGLEHPVSYGSLLWLLLLVLLVVVVLLLLLLLVVVVMATQAALFGSS